MKSRGFTLIELLVAMAIMMFLVQFLVSTFTKTGEVASAHVNSMELFTQAQVVLDKIHDDFRHINLMKKNPRVGVVGDSQVPLPVGQTSSPFSMAFVCSNYDLRQDPDVAMGEANGHLPFDGWVENPGSEHLPSRGLQEVAYYMNKISGDIPTYSLHRAMRSPPTTDSGSLLRKPLSEFSTPTYAHNYKIAEGIIYTSVSYTYLEQRTALDWEPVDKRTYNTLDNTDPFFPGAVNIIVSFAAGLGCNQNEGDLIVPGSTATELVIKKTNGVFPIAKAPEPDNANPETTASKLCKGFIVVGRGDSAGVFEFHSVTFKRFLDGKSQYHFKGEYVVQTNQQDPGTPIIIGHTFSRSYHIR